MTSIISKIKNYKPTILDKYILSQVVIATLICLILFIIVWIAPETLLKVVHRLITGEYTPYLAFRKLALETIKILAIAVPVGILLGSIFTFDKLSKNSELAILRSIGISFNRIMAPVILLGVLASIFCFFANDILIPAASNKLGESKGAGTHFVYIVENPDKTPKQNIIVSKFTPKEIEDITVMNFASEKYTDATTFKSIIFANKAKLQNNKWVMYDVVQYDINSDGIYKKVTRLPQMPILEDNNQAVELYNLMFNATKKERCFTNNQISKYSKLLKKVKFSDEYRYFRAKLYQRYLHPLTCILFAMIGCLLGFSPPRSQRLIGFTIAVGLIFGYYITLPFFDMLAQKGIVNPVIAASFPVILFIILIFILKKVKDL